MSQLSHTTIPLRSQFQAHRVAWAAALVALVATVAIALVVAIDSGSPATSSVAERQFSAPRTDGFKQESTIAAAVGSHASSRPSESDVAAAVGAGSSSAPSSDRPDESATASAISGR